MGTSSDRPELRIFGQRVRDARTSKGLSQEQLAEISGLHRTYVGTIERGERNPALLNILRIADSLGIDACELVRDIHLDTRLSTSIGSRRP